MYRRPNMAAMLENTTHLRSLESKYVWPKKRQRNFKNHSNIYLIPNSAYETSKFTRIFLVPPYLLTQLIIFPTLTCKPPPCGGYPLALILVLRLSWLILGRLRYALACSPGRPARIRGCTLLFLTGPASYTGRGLVCTYCLTFDCFDNACTGSRAGHS